MGQVPFREAKHACDAGQSRFNRTSEKPDICHDPQKTEDGKNLISIVSAADRRLTQYSQRCDGAKPACQQCTKAKKPDACEYDDGKGKTRTQILRENITRLEQRIRELEDPEYTSASVTLFDPHAHQDHRRSYSSASSVADSQGSGISLSHSPFPPGMFLVQDASNPFDPINVESPGSPQGSWIVSSYLTSRQSFGLMSPKGIPSPSPSPFREVYHDDMRPPFELAQML